MSAAVPWWRLPWVLLVRLFRWLDSEPGLRVLLTVVGLYLLLTVVTLRVQGEIRDALDAQVKVLRARIEALDRVNPAEASRVQAYLARRLPRTAWGVPRPSEAAPGLWEVPAGRQVYYYDPLRHQLLLGVVVDLDERRARIAPGAML